MLVLPLLVLSMCLVSCEREIINDEVLTEPTQLDLKNAEVIGLTALVLPKGVDPYTDNDFQKYYANLSEEEVALYVENNRILKYLESFEKDELVLESMKTGESYATVDLTAFLTTEELSMIQNNEPIAAERKTCWVEQYSCLICNGNNYEYHIVECCWSGGGCGSYRIRVETLNWPCSTPGTIWCTG